MIGPAEDNLKVLYCHGAVRRVPPLAASQIRQLKAPIRDAASSAASKCYTSIMSLKNIDFDSAFRRLADKRIEDAIKEGKFDNLPGKGQPLDLQPLPADENARMLWWALKILRQNDVTPDEVRWRKSIELLKEQLDRVKDEDGLRLLVAQINALVHKLHTLGTNAMNGASAVVAVSYEIELEKLKARTNG
ncbi:hypothetical protein BH09PLA1_BH09PLA1_17440 [soil metagenome]